MSQSQFLAGASSLGITDNFTFYIPVTGAFINSSTESIVEWPIRDAGVFSKLYVYVSTNTASVTSTLTFRKSRADTALTLSITSDATGIFEDTTNTVTVAATDEINYEVTVPSETGTNILTLNVIGSIFTPTTTTNTITPFISCSDSGYGFGTASTSQFGLPCAPLNSLSSTATIVNLRIRTAITASDFYVSVTSNTRTTTTTFQTIKNSSNGGQTVSVTSTATGVFEDTSGTDSLAVGDDFCFGITTGTGTGTITFKTASCTGISTDHHFILTNNANAGLGINFNNTIYLGLAGKIDTGATENNTELRPRFGINVSQLTAYINSNTIATSASTIRVRDNGANGNSSLSIGAGLTGNFLDSVNTDTITSATDTVNLQIVTPNTSGLLSPTSISVVGIDSTLAGSASASISPSPSASVSPSASISRSPSVSVSFSISPSPSASVSPSTSVSSSPSPSPSPSLSISLSPSLSPSLSSSLSPSPSLEIPRANIYMVKQAVNRSNTY